MKYYFIDHVQEYLLLCIYVKIKTLKRLQKSNAGGDEKLIINFYAA